MPGREIYFLSDFHLGAPNASASRERENRIVRFLEQKAPDMEALYLLGDVFDFWFEYTQVVPKGSVRFLGQLARLSDAGTPIHFFPGNHDMWMRSYLKDELNIQIHKKPLRTELQGKKFYLAHGDGLGPGDRSYKLLKRIFASRTCQWLYARLHPNFAIAIARYWSSQSRAAQGEVTEFKGTEGEWLASYCRELLQREHFDYLVFGHRHLPLNMALDSVAGTARARYMNLGDWIRYDSFAVLKEGVLKLTNTEGREWEVMKG